MLRKLILVAVSTIVALLVGEVALRRFQRQSHFWGHGPLLHLQPPVNVYDPEIGWVLTPSTVKSRHRLVGANGAALFDVEYSISQGKRLTSYAAHSGPTIVITGCSFTFGHALDDHDTWPWLLQERLPDDNVVNVAAMGYGTDQALMAAERQVSRSPRGVGAVLLGFADFQIERNRSSQDWLWRIYPAGKPLFVQSGSGVAMKGMVKFWSLGSAMDGIADHSVFFSRSMNLLTDRLIYRIPSYDEARLLTVALITDFARRFQARGVPLLVVALPNNLDPVRSHVGGPFMIRQLRAAGVPTLVPDFPQLSGGSWGSAWFNVVGHPTRLYNLVLADQVAPFVRRYVETASSQGRGAPGFNSSYRMESVGRDAVAR
jgi:hypothetical protein